MSAPFTPGPWSVRAAFRPADRFHVFFEERGRGYVRSKRVDSDCSGGFTEANARLIAAAPELYAELAKCVDHDCQCGECNRIRAALAKARGEQ